MPWHGGAVTETRVGQHTALCCRALGNCGGERETGKRKEEKGKGKLKAKSERENRKGEWKGKIERERENGNGKQKG